MGVSAVQGWIATPANNFGLIVESAITTNNVFVTLHSSEATTPANRPKLTVNYEQPTLAAAEIAVQGQGITIVSGDTTPTLVDDTDFGTTAQGVGVTHTFTVHNLGGAALSVTGVTDSGTNADDFSVTAQPASSIAAAGITTFQVQFAPTATGLRTATITVANNDSNESVTTFTCVQAHRLRAPGRRVSVERLSPRQRPRCRRLARLTHSRRRRLKEPAEIRLQTS